MLQILTRVHHVSRIDLDSPQFVNELRPFLLQTTEHFVHELLSFAQAPFDLTAYDECVVYPCPDDNHREENRQNEANVLEESRGNSLWNKCI